MNDGVEAAKVSDHAVCAVYCGMAYDIMTPLTLIDQVDIIYAICRLDEAFSSDGTWEGVKRLILSYLVEGNIDFFLKEWENHYETVQFEKSQVISQNEEKVAEDMTIWRVEFIYRGRRRMLVYYNGWDFYNCWPSEIQKVQHVLSIGTSFSLKKDELLAMLSVRTTDVFTYYRCYYGKNDDAGTMVHTQLNPVVFFSIDKNDVIGQAGAWFE